jgi:hypothetical protein
MLLKQVSATSVGFKIFLACLGVLIICLVAVYYIDTQSSSSIGQPPTESKVGRDAAFAKLAELEQKYPSAHSITSITECASNMGTVYTVDIGFGGYGAGQTYILDSNGKELYYQACDTAPSDGCDLKESRGTSPQIDYKRCVHLDTQTSQPK